MAKATRPIREYFLVMSSDTAAKSQNVYSRYTLDEVCKIVRTVDWCEFSLEPDDSRSMVFRTARIDGIVEVSQ